MMYFIWIMAFIIQGVIFMCLTYYVAVQKGRDNNNWLWLGFFLGFFGLLTVGFVPDLTNNMITVNQNIEQGEAMNDKEVKEFIDKLQKEKSYEHI